MTTTQKTQMLTGLYVKACAAGNRRRARVLLSLISSTNGTIFAAIETEV